MDTKLSVEEVAKFFGDAPEKKVEKYRSRAHALVLYPEDSSHASALDKIAREYESAWILHDKDVDEDGVIKKPHWHVILRFKQAVWNSAVAKELGIELNYLEQVRNFSNALLYLIHFNDSDKYQYDKDDVKGSLAKRLYEEINKLDKSEGEKVGELIEFIVCYDGYLSVTDFARYCALNGYWDVYRRAGAIFNKMIDEHNVPYLKRS